MHTHREEQAPVWRERSALAATELCIIGIDIDLDLDRQIDG